METLEANLWTQSHGAMLWHLMEFSNVTIGWLDQDYQIKRRGGEHPEPQGAIVVEGAEWEVGKDNKPRKLPASMHAWGQPDCRLIMGLFFKPLFVEYLLIIYLEEKMNAPWGEAEKEGVWWWTAYILNPPEQFSSGPNWLILLAEQKPCSYMDCHLQSS